MTAPLLQIDGLRVQFTDGPRTIRAVDGVDLAVGEGEIVALVGESGCGKTVTALSVTRLVPCPPGRIVGGRVVFQGRDLLRLPERDLRGVRGREIAYVFQDPGTSLNPVLTIGEQLAEVIALHRGLRGEAAQALAAAMLERVGIGSAREQLRGYPHQLSGGMKQRVMLAMALVSQARLLIADEPTTALDVTIQAQILDLLRSLRLEAGLAVLLITHDLSIVARTADRIVVMYAGRVVEDAPAAAFYQGPRHPYAIGLLACLPAAERGRQRLRAIEGTLPNPAERLPGCVFHPRCAWGEAACTVAEPALAVRGPGHRVRCIKEVEGRPDGR